MLFGPTLEAATDVTTNRDLVFQVFPPYSALYANGVQTILQELYSRWGARSILLMTDNSAPIFTETSSSIQAWAGQNSFTVAASSFWDLRQLNSSQFAFAMDVLIIVSIPQRVQGIIESANAAGYFPKAIILATLPETIDPTTSDDIIYPIAWEPAQFTNTMAGRYNLQYGREMSLTAAQATSTAGTLINALIKSNSFSESDLLQSLHSFNFTTMFGMVQFGSSEINGIFPKISRANQIQNNTAEFIFPTSDSRSTSVIYPIPIRSSQSSQDSQSSQSSQISQSSQSSHSGNIAPSTIDGNSSQPALSPCFNTILGRVCVDLEFDNCTVDFSITLGGDVIYRPDPPPISEFNEIFSPNATCIKIAGACSICTNWKNLSLTHDTAGGCGELSVGCIGEKRNFNLGCFQDDNVVAECFSECKEDCNFRGVCRNSFCQCMHGYTGDACEIAPSNACPNNCGGSLRGRCVNDVCQCQNNFSGNDCSQYIAQVSVESSVNRSWVGWVIGISVIVFVVILIFAAFFIYKKLQKRKDTFYGFEDSSNVEMSSS
eukprot:TRINITY_DN4766_c0_g2_i3.p1 TRINITY_DN4766_c0_g2~~TRINITY_DN4766_c0_g2_i3.p1  ORF type:complete len:546 (-),score=137.31 TRINITY_DN4766_c0_g2_i3:24-1661(-)